MKYYKGIDGLRFVAIFLVLIQHFATFIGNWISAGYYGVDLFFAISGFLITGILINSEKPFAEVYKKFIIRRGLRIFPLYYLVVLILFLLALPSVREYLFFYLTYTFNYAEVYFKMPMDPTTPFWSLCVEEQFYILWPCLVLLLRKKLNLLKCIITVFFLLAIMQQAFNIFKSVEPYNYAGLFPRCSTLLLGGLGAILLKEGKLPLKILDNKLLEALSILLLCICLYTGFSAHHYLLVFISPFISLFLLLKTTQKGFAFTSLNWFLNNKKVVFLGTISYGIYIFHVPIAFYTTNIFDSFWNSINWDSKGMQMLGILNKIRWQQWFFRMIFNCSLTVFIAYLSYKYFEKPILQLKERFKI